MSPMTPQAALDKIEQEWKDRLDAAQREKDHLHGQLSRIQGVIAEVPLELLGPAAAKGDGTLDDTIRKVLESYQFKLEQAKIMLPALSILQPFASAIMHGYKHIETRGWSTQYRGKVVIHAGKSDRYQLTFEGLKDAGYLGKLDWQKDFPLGAILGTALVVDCKRVEEIETSDRERALGDYRSGIGRWGIVLDKVAPLADPIPWQGQQGWFKVPQAVLL